MKPEKLILFLLSLLALSVIPAVQAGTAGSENSLTTSSKTRPAITVSYDKVSDQLNVAAEAVSLKSVLGKIAWKSGIEVLFDDLADESVSIDIQSESLESGLKRMLKGRNYLMRYNRDEQQQLLLIGVMVLPVGESDTGRARRLVAMDDEAFYRARNQLSLEQVQQMDMTNERWQARLAELPPESREKLEKKVAARQRKQMQRELQHAKVKEDNERMFAEQKEQQLKAREQALKSLDPEERAAFEQRSKEAHEQVKATVLGEKK